MKKKANRNKVTRSCHSTSLGTHTCSVCGEELFTVSSNKYKELVKVKSLLVEIHKQLKEVNDGLYDIKDPKHSYLLNRIDRILSKKR